MSTKEDSLLPSNASITALLPEGAILVGGAIVFTPISFAKSSKSIGVKPLCLNKMTSAGGSDLWLCVKGTRRTLATSDVTAGSAFSPYLAHVLLKLSATGTQSSGGILSDKGQYACMPLPESAHMGLGKLILVQNSPRARKASVLVK